MRIPPGLIFAALCLSAGCSRPDPLLRPEAAAMTAAAPDSFVVTFETTKGDFSVLARRAWAPRGVDRFHYLVTHGFYDDTRFFRVVPGFVAQFGLPADPAVAEVWREQTLPDDSVRTTNARGTVAFARGGPASRSTQLFVNVRDNARLDALNGFGFPPIGVVVSGMAVVDSLYAGYGDGGPAPVQDSIRMYGNAYLDRLFPRLDRIRRARIVGK